MPELARARRHGCARRWRLRGASATRRSDWASSGITGTDGKTTTAYLVRAILEAAGYRTGFVGHDRRHRRRPEPRQRRPHEHAGGPRAAGVPGAHGAPPATRWAVVESTSHGLAQQRVGGVAYDVAVLTNITSEHLEFHGTLEAYREAKQTPLRAARTQRREPREGLGQARHRQRRRPARRGRRGHRERRGGRRAALWPRAVAWPATRRPGAARTSRPRPSPRHRLGCAWPCRRRAGSGSLELRLAGRFNVHNALAAMGVASAIGAGPGCRGRCPGRGSRASQAACSASTRVSRSASSSTTPTPPRPSARCSTSCAPADPSAGCIAVFGSAGERDVAKRAEMGRVAGERCRSSSSPTRTRAARTAWPSWRPSPRVPRRPAGSAARTSCVIPDRAEAIAVAMRPGAPRRRRPAGRQGPRDDHRDGGRRRSPGTRPRRPGRPCGRRSRLTAGARVSDPGRGRPCHELLHGHVGEPVALVGEQHDRDTLVREVPHRGFEAPQAAAVADRPGARRRRPRPCRGRRTRASSIVVICASDSGASTRRRRGPPAQTERSRAVEAMAPAASATVSAASKGSRRASRVWSE